MSGFYRIGKPGEDTVAHINTGRRSSGEKCRMPRFELDNATLGHMCGRISVALCDEPGCDKPVCDLHRVKHPARTNTDYCSDHRESAGKPLKLTRRAWIKLYGERNYIEDLRAGFWAVPCLNCTDSVCHGWKMERIAPL